MDHLLHLAQTLASFALVLGILITFHELGHYWAARWCNVGVEAFSLGFGPTLTSWTDRHGTVWKISLLPLGGYVKMHGMGGEAEDEDAQAAAFRPELAFGAKKIWQRGFIIAAGPIANFVLAIVLFAGLQASIGAPVALPFVGQVVEGSAAAKAGMKTGDEIVAVDATRIETFDQLRSLIAGLAERDVTLHLRRAGQDLALPVHIRGVGLNHATGQLGVGGSPDKIVMEKRGPLQAIEGGVESSWNLASQILSGLGGLFTTGAGAGDLGGPIAIALASRQMALLGLASLITWIAGLSVNLGLLNLLPIPVLDGGHLLFLAAEALRGRPLPQRAQEYGFGLGLAIIATVFLFTFHNDLAHLGLFTWMQHLIG